MEGSGLFSCGRLDVRVQQRVVFEHDGGMDVGKIVRGPLPLLFDREPIGRVVRRLTDFDLRTLQENRELEDEAIEVSREEMLQRGLPMRPIRAHVRIDRHKVLIFFISDDRVDFRGLVRDLAERLRSRVELKQVGARQASAHWPALGTCGRPTCCSQWRQDFHSITLDAVKEQNLTHNLSKLHGHCGRLKCCLLYEIDTYREFDARAPRCGQGVCSGRCSNGRATVIGHNPVRGTVMVVDDEDKRYEIPLDEIENELRSRPWVRSNAKSAPPPLSSPPDRSGGGNGPKRDRNPPRKTVS
ncbi:MAG: hypothetical protein HYT87_07650 [Nitrospirae bacterium]|nr:hypothetical protein [Nitrospirota bacterium]